ncbi:TVP38/TMEM64 family protein [Legionella saoudiensis]|uniref:TVP38/TMEM64 family protein n=1 Tax=Legionella saoudiensis TaxID=1750561 RepID=UPI00098F6304|nr:TVP38/TMEM64 family protein [Legionella saoudiensis]
MTAIRPAKLFYIAIALTLFCTAAFFFHKYASEIISWVDQLGWLAPVLFIIIYCLATLMFVPTMVITLAGGALFGPTLGTLVNLLGATWGAACSFLITRYFSDNWLPKNKDGNLMKLIRSVEQKGWVSVALLRLFPIIPFNLVNYGLGVTGISFRTYLLTTFIFLIPPEIIYTYFGYAGMDVLMQQGSFYRNSGVIISGIALLLLCLCKIGVLKIKKPFKQPKTTLVAQATDDLLANQFQQKNESLESPAKNS